MIMKRILQVYCLIIFSTLFTSSNPTGLDFIDNHVGGRINDEMLRLLGKSFIGEKVEEAFFQMHPTKALGPDGTPAYFYQQLWDLVRPYVKQIVLEVLNNGRDPSFLS